MVAQNI